MSPRRRFALLFGLVAAVYACGTHARVFSAGNDASRWAQIESIVDYGETTIERSRFANTVDRVEVGGRLYSNKPPFLSLVGVALYAPLEVTTGWRLGSPESAGRAVWMLTLLLVGLPAALTVALFDRMLARFDRLGAGGRWLCDLALAGGTLLASYSGTLNHHVPAAALLLATLAALLAERPGSGGLACGFAAAVDLLPGLGMAPFFALALWASRGGRTAARFVAGLAPGAAALLASNWAVTGTLLPPKLLPGGVDLSARAGRSIAGVVLPESPLYPVDVLFGWHGILLVSPVLVVGAFGLILAWRRPPFATRALWRGLALGLVAQFVGHALVAGSYGGWSYGYRYLLPIEPLLLFAAPVALAGRGGRILFALLLPPSLLFAALGAYHPWPPAYEQSSNRDPVAALVRDPITGNAAAWCEQYFPDRALTRALGERFVSRDAAERRRYFRYFFGSKGDLTTMRRYEP